MVERKSLILLEHHDVIKSADWLIELGRRWRKWRTASLQERQQIC